MSRVTGDSQLMPVLTQAHIRWYFDLHFPIIGHKMSMKIFQISHTWLSSTIAKMSAGSILRNISIEFQWHRP